MTPGKLPPQLTGSPNTSVHGARLFNEGDLSLVDLLSELPTDYAPTDDSSVRLEGSASPTTSDSYDEAPLFSFLSGGPRLCISPSASVESSLSALAERPSDGVVPRQITFGVAM